MLETSNEEMRLKFNFATPSKKRPERHETVRAFGLSVYIASLSSVSRYLESRVYPTLVTAPSIATESLTGISLTLND